MARVVKARKRSVFSVVLAFSEPPSSFRFARAKSGTSWWRSVPSRAEAIEIGLRLSDLGIRGVVKPAKRDQPPPVVRKVWRVTESEAVTATPIRQSPGAGNVQPMPKRGYKKIRVSHAAGEFGGILNATPIRGAWRRRKKPL